ncbi:MAG: UDP-2,3-diacylglucosamine diphosphatase [Pirellulales bacterium]|nr:UDP-2,3-diacylglucosamine diphosphatase [Pirellulales bacterium]
MRHFDTVVISDLHLGARNSRTTDILHFLGSIHAEQWIVNGDLFEDPRLRGLRCADVAVLDALRGIAAHSQLILLKGNHDPEPHWYGGLLGLPVREEITIQVGSRRYLVCHGDRWDGAMQLPGWLIGIADAIYLGSQRIDPSHRLAKVLKRKCKTFVRAVKNLRERAAAVARERGFDGIILGHTHMPEDVHLEGVHYLNSGCWTERPTGYIGVRQGRAACYSWTGQPEGRIESRDYVPAIESATRKELDPTGWALAGV